MASLSLSKIILFFFLSFFPEEFTITKVEIKNWKKTKPKIIFSLPVREEEIFELQKEIVNFYLKEGFFDVKVNIGMKKEKKNFILIYFIDERERYQIGKIDIQSKIIKSDTLEKLIKEKDYSQNNLNKIIKKIADFYWEIGFPFVKIDLKDFQLEGKRVNFTITIEEGEMVKINDLSSEGEIVVKEKLLKRAANFTKPFYFQKSLIEKMKKYITRNLNLNVDNYFLTLDERKEYSLTFHFPYQRKNNFFFLFSYLPTEKTLFLNLTLKLFNFLNNLEEFNLEIEKGERKNFYFFSYQQPYLFIFKKILSSLSFQNFDTSYSNFDLNFNFYLPTKINELTLNFIFQQEFYNSRLSTSPSSQISLMGQELIFNNKIDNYHSGTYFSLKGLVGERKIANRPKSLKLKTETKLEFLFSFLKENFLFHSEFFVGNIFLKDTLYDYEKFSLTGKNNIRGFPENKYFSSFLLVFRNHFKYSYKNSFFPYLFIDHGYGREEKLISLTSYGLGLDFFTQRGIFYLIFSLPMGLNLFDARIYFGYTYYF